MEELICFAFGRHVSDRCRVVGGADPYSKHFNGFVGERLAAPAAGGWIKWMFVEKMCVL